MCKIETFVPIDQRNLGGRWTLTLEPKHRVRMEEVVQTGTEEGRKQVVAVEEAAEVVAPQAEEAAEGEVTSFETVEEGASCESLLGGQCARGEAGGCALC